MKIHMSLFAGLLAVSTIVPARHAEAQQWQCKVTCSGEFGSARGQPTTAVVQASDVHAANRAIEPQARSYCAQFKFYRDGVLGKASGEATPYVSCERR